MPYTWRPWPSLLAALFAVCCVLLASFIGSLLYMVVLHHRLKERGLRREEMLLATPLPRGCRPAACRGADSVVQRRRPSLRRGIEAAAELDWPRDKLHIQVLDDSTDETAEMVAHRGGRAASAKGFDVVALQRTDR